MTFVPKDLRATKDPLYWRARADMALGLATNAVEPTARRHLLAMAATCERRAQAAERMARAAARFEPVRARRLTAGASSLTAAEAD
ncbi:MAG: hypothetical protein FJX35_04015 [Alphaproteobacteria bacterium]|nr:hypothetical protein [Alphaproteobacteria bacterium]